MKLCAKCGEAKPETEFYSHPHTADRFMALCKECHKAAATRRRRTNPAVQEYDRARGSRMKPGYIKERREAFPEMYRAHTAVGNALRSGKLKREPCLFCEATENIHGHHRDYSKPLDVVWLCAKCHRRLHAVFPETAAHEPAA